MIPPATLDKAVGTRARLHDSIIDLPAIPGHPARSRLILLVSLLATILLGLASRQIPRTLPGPISKYPGDVLWASSIFLIIALIRPRGSTRFCLFTTLTFSLAIETFKLCGSPWAESIRGFGPGRLIFGWQFSGWNLICYALGAGAAAALHSVALRSKGEAAGA